ncbi:MAG: hypothetical protein GX893_01675 [Firmicutes bacterium]|nr:hypothetical protein [Bacillota bacterium]
MKSYSRKKARFDDKECNVVPFEQDAAFYLQKGLQHYQKNRLNKALFYFQKAVSVEPDNPFNHYNLACMLSKMGQLKEANRIFLHIVNKLDCNMAECYFLLAVNYGLLEEMEKSCEYLRYYLQIAPEGEMAREAKELLLAFEEDEQWEPLPSYSERDFYLEGVLQAATVEDLKILFSDSKEFRRALLKCLYSGPDDMTEQVLLVYEKIGSEAARKVLRKYAANPWIKERFRQLALAVLKNLGEKKVRLYLAGKFTEVDLNEYPLQTPYWRPEWQQVVECTVGNMRHRNCYDEGFILDVQAIWHDFINTVFPETPRITKVETWAAALEYSVARFHFLNLTQKELAAEYGVSCASISNNFRKIEKALNLIDKAYQNILHYLYGDYEE